MNRAILSGNVGKDPDIGSTQSGTKFARFPFATSDRWKDKQSGEKKEHTEWHQIVVWSEQLIDGVIAQYVKKGTKLIVEGEIRTRRWTDDKGIERYSTEIVLQGFGGRIELLGQPQPRPGDAPMDGAEPPYGGGARPGSNADSQRPLSGAGGNGAYSGSVSANGGGGLDGGYGYGGQDHINDQIPF